MSFQTISAEQASETHPLRIIAKSPHLPHGAEGKLLSEAQRIICGTEFYSYSVMEHQGQQLHLLAAGICAHSQTIVHQVILNEHEVSGLQQSNSRPTPAGIMLALLHNKHWVRNTSEQRNLAEEPHVAAADLPDASEQRKWKKVTGHKNDVRIFHTRPFDRQCMAIYPSGCTPANMLELLNESQWLTTERGWGQAFHISNGLPGQEIATHAGICATNALTAVDDTYRELPVLRIEQHLASTEKTAPATMPAKVTDEHYQYTECPDYDIFDIPTPGSATHRRNMIFGLVAVLLIAGGWVSYSYIRTALSAEEDEAISTKQMFLSAIHDGDYSADTQLKSLESALRKQNTAESNAMLECIRIFTEDASDCGGHPNNMLILLRLADSLGMNGEKLCLSYLSKVLSSYRPEDWIRENTSTEELAEWKHLLTRAPELKNKLKYEAEYRAYMHDIILRTEKTAHLHH